MKKGKTTTQIKKKLQSLIENAVPEKEVKTKWGNIIEQCEIVDGNFIATFPGDKDTKKMLIKHLPKEPSLSKKSYNSHAYDLQNDLVFCIEAISAGVPDFVQLVKQSKAYMDKVTMKNKNTPYRGYFDLKQDKDEPDYKERCALVLEIRGFSSQIKHLPYDWQGRYSIRSGNREGKEDRVRYYAGLHYCLDMLPSKIQSMEEYKKASELQIKSFKK